MHFNILSLFPEFFDSPLACGLMGRAVENGLVGVTRINPRDFAEDRHKSVDDSPYGGGPGMVMSLPPLTRAVDSLEKPGRLVLLTPSGRPLDQPLARELAKEQALTLVCGRYEGIDARFQELYPVTEVSVGDYVLNGGEAAALCLMEAVARLTPGFMGKLASGEEESFSASLLEYPHYTRPEEFRGLTVPEILLSGDHGRIARWRREMALTATLRNRPDLMERAEMDTRDAAFLKGLSRVRRGKNLCLALLHHPVLSKVKKVSTVSLTNLDLHDISRVSRSYGVRKVYVVTPLTDQRELAETLVAHWSHGRGAERNPHRAEAMRLISVVPDLDAALQEAGEFFGRTPRLVATSARHEGAMAPAELAARLDNEAAMLMLGTGHGLAKEVMRRADWVLRPIRPFADYNHMSVRSAAAIFLDRILGDIY